MSRRGAVAASLTMLTIGLAFLFGTPVKFDPNVIDPHWYGVPLSPCFVNAKACFGHTLGTDELGRDVLARLVVGGRVSLGLSLIAVVLELIFGIIFDAVSHIGGVVLKFIIARFAEAISCFPAWPFLLGMTVIGRPPSQATLSGFVFAALTATLFWPRVMRLVAAAGSVRGAIPVVLNQAALDWAQIIALLAAVDFTGFGIQPPTASWGDMLVDWPEKLTLDWWSVLFPALCLFSAVLVIEIVRRLMFAKAAAVTDWFPKMVDQDGGVER